MTPDASQNQPKPKKRGLRITLIVIGSIIGVIALLVLAMILFVTFRPATTGDFKSAHSEIEAIDGPPLIAALAMVGSLTNPTTASNKNNLSNRYINTLNQVNTVNGYVEDASSKLAFKKDKEAGDAYEQLRQASADLKQYVKDYEPLFVPIGEYWRACAGSVQSSQETCDKLIGEVKSAMSQSGGNESQRAIGQAIIDQNGTDFAAATKQVSMELTERGDALQDQLGKLLAVLESKMDK